MPNFIGAPRRNVKHLCKHEHDLYRCTEGKLWTAILHSSDKEVEYHLQFASTKIILHHWAMNNKTGEMEYHRTPVYATDQAGRVYRVTSCILTPEFSKPSADEIRARQDKYDAESKAMIEASRRIDKFNKAFMKSERERLRQERKMQGKCKPPVVYLNDDDEPKPEPIQSAPQKVEAKPAPMMKQPLGLAPVNGKWVSKPRSVFVP